MSNIPFTLTSWSMLQPDDRETRENRLAGADREIGQRRGELRSGEPRSQARPIIGMRPITLNTVFALRSLPCIDHSPDPGASAAGRSRVRAIRYWLAVL